MIGRARYAMLLLLTADKLVGFWFTYALTGRYFAMSSWTKIRTVSEMLDKEL